MQATSMSQAKKNLLARRKARGASIVEYALLLFLILGVGYIAFRNIGPKVKESARETGAAFEKGAQP